MAKFKLFNVKSGKEETISTSEIKKRTAKSTQWFRDKIATQFKGKKEKIDGGAKPARPIPGSRAQKQSAKRDTAQRNQGDKFTNSNTSLDKTFKQNTRVVAKPEIGRLYMYVYDPKHKKTLPYFDVFPMVFVMDHYPDGFLGMNLHYLNPLLRAALINELLKFKESTTRKGKKEEYLNISYHILKAAGANKYFQPTIKRYLFNHVKSPFAEVLAPEWEIAAFLPVEQFRKSNKREVWADSRTKL